MSKEPSTAIVVSPFGKMGSVAVRNPQAMAGALASSAQSGMVGMAPEGSEYMNFTGKRGVYELGQAKEDISPDELWLINIASFQAGYVCWKGGQPQATRLASIYGPPVQEPDYNEFGPFKQGDGWASAKALVTASVDRAGKQGYFKTSSKSGVGTVSGLEDAVAQRMLAGQPCWPLVFWKKEKFTAQGNVNWKPVAEIYGWITAEAINELSNPDCDLDELIGLCENGQYAGPSIPQVQEPEPEPVQEPEPVEPEPATQVVRRRAASSVATAVEPEPATASALTPGAARRSKRSL